MISSEGRSLALVTFVTTDPSMTRQSLQARDSTGHIAALTESSTRPPLPLQVDILETW